MAPPRKYERPPTFICQQCGIEKPCRKNFWRKRNKNCGYIHRQKFCSPSCANDAQRTGFVHKRSGYKIVSVNGKHRHEHSVVMETMLGRSLLRGETVHHRDGNRQNNTPSNLELWTSRHHPGQRVSDRVEAAKAILSDYAIHSVPPGQNEIVLAALSIGA
jgi:hypothetical protein